MSAAYVIGEVVLVCVAVTAVLRRQTRFSDVAFLIGISYLGYLAGVWLTR